MIYNCSDIACMSHHETEAERAADFDVISIGLVVERPDHKQKDRLPSSGKQNPPFLLELGAAGDGPRFAAPGLGSQGPGGPAPSPCSASGQHGPFRGSCVCEPTHDQLPMSLDLRRASAPLLSHNAMAKKCAKMTLASCS